MNKIRKCKTLNLRKMLLFLRTVRNQKNHVELLITSLKWKWTTKKLMDMLHILVYTTISKGYEFLFRFFSDELHALFRVMWSGKWVGYPDEIQGRYLKKISLILESISNHFRQ